MEQDTAFEAVVSELRKGDEDRFTAMEVWRRDFFICETHECFSRGLPLPTPSRATRRLAKNTAKAIVDVAGLLRGVQAIWATEAG